MNPRRDDTGHFEGHPSRDMLGLRTLEQVATSLSLPAKSQGRNVAKAANLPPSFSRLQTVKEETVRAEGYNSEEGFDSAACDEQDEHEDLSKLEERES